MIMDYFLAVTKKPEQAVESLLKSISERGRLNTLRILNKLLFLNDVEIKSKITCNRLPWLLIDNSSKSSNNSLNAIFVGLQ